MKILLVHPAPKENSLFSNLIKKFWPLHPMTLPQLAAVTPSNHNITCIDETFQQIDFSEDYDLVGITCNTPLAPRAYEIADGFRDNGSVVVLGGVHPSAMPHEAKEHADSVVIGEGEISWPKIVNDLERKGKIKPFYKSELIDGKMIPPPAWEKFGNFNLTARIQATRGCPYNCEFCSLHIVEGRKLRMKPVENVIKEIISCKKKWITFVDNSLTLNPSYTKEIFRKMKGLGKKFACFGNINVLAKDKELLKLAKEAGCVAWEIGFESVSQKSLNEAGKGMNKVERYKKAIETIKEYGMAVIGSFIFGFDSDTPDIFDVTLEAIYELELDSVTCNILTPYPGTKLFERLEKENRILTRDWSKYDLGHVVFKPKNMSEKELFYGTKKVIRSIYNPLNQLRMDIKSFKLGLSPFIATAVRNYCNIDFYRRSYFSRRSY